jgi:UDP-N-acetylmuramyl pentapeptide phosphotransferase/UDP-N-acetylglucosamine-1-phosphate transferase
VSFVDDLRSLPVLARLAAQALAAGLLVRGGLAPATLDLPGLAWALPPLAGAALAVGYTVWMANLYNFMDGMDGFAGGMAVFGFGTLAVLGAQAGEAGFALACVAVAAAAAGFLALNFPPARIFMGDVGSSTLGFLAAALSLWGARAGLFPLWAAVLAFSPFIADATVTLFRRLLAGEKIWQAHRCHYYQRLVRLGWGHRKTVLAEYLLMLACALSAVLAARGGLALQWAALAAWAFGYAGLALAVGRLERGAGVEAAP